MSQPQAEKSWTIGGLLDWTAKFLAEKGAEFPRLDAEVLLAHALGCRRIELYTRHGEPAPEDARQKYREQIRKRIEGCPVAYLVGRKEFFSLEFEVSPAVLIPRPESEFIVVECLRFAQAIPEPRILDLGTGSGNLAISIAQQHKKAHVTAVDISTDALAIAGRNASKHGVAERITFLQGDLFAPIPQGEQFDFIVSNPPYIPTPEIAKLQPGVRDFEPHLALDGGPDGYTAFERIISKAGEFLKPGGHLIVEIGAPQEKEARARLSRIPNFELVETIQDYSGHPRVLRAKWKG